MNQVLCQKFIIVKLSFVLTSFFADSRVCAKAIRFLTPRKVNLKPLMMIADLLRKLRDEKKLEDGQAGLLIDLQERKIISVHRELRFFLYLGILMVIAGAGLTVKQYFLELGDAAVISALTLGAAAAFIYCFLKGGPFAKDAVSPPNVAFDYILFFGCAFFSMLVAYIEVRYHVLGDAWKNYLLISVVLFFFLAYRFDNRLVLSLALSTLAAWFGFTLSGFRLFSLQEYYRLYAIAYALIVLGAGAAAWRLDVKKHFLDIYLNFAVHFLGAALIAGIARYKLLSLYFPALLVAGAALALYSVRTRKFLYMLYAAIYGYIGISIVVFDFIHRETFLAFAYFIATSLAVVGLIFKMSRRFKEGE
ncbi:MAG: DUF2157 domain-containing protein [Deltaproteobacteria bacterium]|nr:DUF2157 domain-containing protein [Deltaproteobacteria bacterium]